MPFGLQPIHLVVVFVIALIIFGPRRLPEFGRGIGKAINEFRQGTRDMTESLQDEISRPNRAAQTATAQGPSVAQAALAATANFCANCGSPNPAEARFCNKCGLQLPA